MAVSSALIGEVAIARNGYLNQIKDLTEKHAAFKASEEVWNVIENTEHLFWAEQGALYGMWKTLYAIRDGKAVRTYEFIHKDWPLEKIIENTWKMKEIVPPVAAPRLGGTLVFWRNSLTCLQALLESFGKDINDEELRLQAHPHPISGPMDFHQRLEFLAFHLRRHQQQVAGILKSLS